MDEAVVPLSVSLNDPDFDFEELTVAVSDLEKRRLQKLVEESDIEMTKFLFYGDSCECVTEEKNVATAKNVALAKNVVDGPVKKPFIKKAKKTVEPSGVVKVDRKKMTLARINEVFGGSDLDPYELE
jgi:hypothetical protein